MDMSQDKNYYKGYIAGYRDGIRNAAYGKAQEINENEIMTFPIKIMTISTRGLNCLSMAGCIYIADVAALSEHTIRSIRNMGTKTASEIAHWLDAHGICYSAWSKYL